MCHESLFSEIVAIYNYMHAFLEEIIYRDARNGWEAGKKYLRTSTYCSKRRRSAPISAKEPYS